MSAGPDILTDVRIGFDARILGDPKGPFRLGAGAQLYVPSANEDPAEYVTDGTVRAMGRVLFAGDVGMLTYAGQLGAHVRPRDDSPTPGAPQGSELLFGAAKLNLRILDQPVHYQERVFGATKMTRVFRNGLIMLLMCVHGFRKLKMAY